MKTVRNWNNVVTLGLCFLALPALGNDRIEDLNYITDITFKSELEVGRNSDQYSAKTVTKHLGDLELRNGIKTECYLFVDNVAPLTDVFIRNGRNLFISMSDSDTVVNLMDSARRNLGRVQCRYKKLKYFDLGMYSYYGYVWRWDVILNRSSLEKLLPVDAKEKAFQRQEIKFEQVAPSSSPKAEIAI